MHVSRAAAVDKVFTDGVGADTGVCLKCAGSGVDRKLGGLDLVGKRCLAGEKQ